MNKILSTVVGLALAFFPGCSKQPPSPEEALSVLVSNPKLSEDEIGPHLVGVPTFVVTTAKSETPSHYATIKGTAKHHGTHYEFSFTAFFKAGKWFYDPSGPMFLDQLGDPWSSSDPAKAGNLCSLVALYRIGLGK